MRTAHHSPLSLAGQMAMMMPSVASADEQKARERQARAEIIAIREARLQQTRAVQDQHHLDVVLEAVIGNPGAGTTYIAKAIDHDRKFTHRKLLLLEKAGLVINVGSGKLLKWRAT